MSKVSLPQWLVGNPKWLKFLSVVENPHFKTSSCCLLVPLTIFHVFISIFGFWSVQLKLSLRASFCWICFSSYGTEDRCVLFLLVALAFVAVSLPVWCMIRTSLYWVYCTGSGVILDRSCYLLCGSWIIQRTAVWVWVLSCIATSLGCARNEWCLGIDLLIDVPQLQSCPR